MLAFREHFFTVSDVPHLTCVLLVQDAVIAATDLAAAKEQQQEQQAVRERAADSGWSPVPTENPVRLLPEWTLGALVLCNLDGQPILRPFIVSAMRPRRVVEAQSRR